MREAGSVKRLRKWASADFEFYKLNEHLLAETLAISFDPLEDEQPRQAILIDATFISKIGKHIEELGSCEAHQAHPHGLPQQPLSPLA